MFAKFSFIHFTIALFMTQSAMSASPTSEKLSCILGDGKIPAATGTSEAPSDKQLLLQSSDHQAVIRAVLIGESLSVTLKNVMDADESGVTDTASFQKAGATDVAFTHASLKLGATTFHASCVANRSAK